MYRASLFQPSGLTSRVKLLLASLLSMLLLPTFSFAAGGENVKLIFSSQDKIYLGISGAFGLIALGFAFGLRSWVLKQSPGNEKMQEVGGAIHAGALAYLRQQFTTMAIFVVILAGVLFGIYNGTFGSTVAIYMSVCFVLGVGASYTAGYVGMDMAVRANMRTAAAALTSYKKSLEVAFRAGAVAGLITVGMGLLGATIIFFVAGENATKLLVGFGFGGSLAALFMRVGGGIFTKAADVGADLVGKVEAGIPEDDPRNPAVIADNVGDNVGDCAGMAADVFESYEVTLVAAIVLGAATAAIFDTQTWMKLIMFALMARGVGIIASIAGIFMVKGSEDINSDPLKAIGGGFRASAAIATLATLGLAWYMMGGQGNLITTNQLVTGKDSTSAQNMAVIGAQFRVAARDHLSPLAVPIDAVAADPAVKALGLTDEEKDFVIGQAMTMDPKTAGDSDKLQGFTKVDFENPNSDVLGYATYKEAATQDNPLATPEFVTLKEKLGPLKLVMHKVKITEVLGATDTRKPIEQTFYYGPVSEDQATQTMTALKAQAGDKAKVEVGEAQKVNFYANSEGEIYMGVDDYKGNVPAHRLEPVETLVYFKATPKEMKELNDKSTAERAELTKKSTDLNLKKTDLEKKLTDANTKKAAFDKAKKTAEAAALAPTIKDLTDQIAAIDRDSQALRMTVPNPNPVPIQSAVVVHKVVPWWKFFLCIVFGVLMAFFFEKLTDYYVSLRKKPVNEVASTATAGPAPMIITGFAYGQESSVFSVFAIVACLIAPLLIFAPAEYGSYLLSFYGIALVGLGLLTTTGFILAMDTFGPISDNAQGVFEMSGAGHDNPEGNRRVQLLDAAGNTTKALTKGFAIATAVVAAVALFHAFVEEGRLSGVGMRLEIPQIFFGLLLGGAAPYLFSAFSINAVGRAAFELINEVRSQFRNDPGIMLGTSKPDYAKCVAISTAAAQRELLGPGILAIAFPILVAFGFSIGSTPTMIGGQYYNLVGAQALGGFLAGTILSGQLLAVMLANSGGIWDNAKKLIEDGLFGGKGTDAHKAAVVCDTVGDPFKDTAGPALNPLIKVMNLVALLIAPQVIRPLGDGVLTAITVAAAIALVIAIWWSKRGSMGDSMNAAAAEAAAADTAPVE
jgi:K(+)-stimulated pyrophosphate-energized sodium pump